VYHPSLALVNHASLRPVEEAATAWSCVPSSGRAPRSLEDFFAELAG
jgi:hypothetical protein